MKPTKPEEGMRVIYGRTGYSRTGWKGTVIKNKGVYFTVKWDETSSSHPTEYQAQAWSKTPLGETYRDRDVHYIFFDVNSDSNSINFPLIFNCGLKATNEVVEGPLNPELIQPTENTQMKKTLIKQTLVKEINLKDANVETLINLICELENEIDSLKAIRAQSAKIADLIKEKTEAIEEVVTELDSRK